MTAKIQKVFGRQIVDCFLVVKKGRKVADFRVNLSLGHGECEVYSNDWEK